MRKRRCPLPRCARCRRRAAIRGWRPDRLTRGAMEAAFCALAIRDGFIPGNPHLVAADEACAELNLPRETLAERPCLVLNNSSGFGGSNVCHVLKPPTAS